MQEIWKIWATRRNCALAQLSFFRPAAGATAPHFFLGGVRPRTLQRQKMREIWRISATRHWRQRRQQQVQLALLAQKYLHYEYKSTDTDAERLCTGEAGGTSAAAAAAFVSVFQQLVKHFSS
jgi:hypothetical protein